eukprot:TRINITY_DN3772_c0_g1_i1.p1 TRINITY_DN3772_c0_g1~~TRINITY_DN3772_c0_g1_i1.p1  ORF type:complete len:971 (-),score=160.93 TRINITY_DN3772_c0_g1_i1:190-3102(-)
MAAETKDDAKKPEDGKLLDAPKLSLQSKIMLQKLKLWKKIADGDLHAVTNSDVAGIFDVLDPEEKGQIPTSMIFSLLQLPRIALTSYDLKCLCEDADRDGSGFVTPDEIFQALTLGTVAFNIIKGMVNKSTREIDMHECSREDLLTWVKKEYEVTSALYSMPLVFAVLVAYLFFVSFHVDGFNAWRVHNQLYHGFRDLQLGGIKVWYWTPKDHMAYLRGSWADTYFRQDWNIDPIPGRVHRYNQMLAGPRLHREYRTKEPCSVNPTLSALYNAVDGMCYNQGEIMTEDIVMPYQVDSTTHREMLKNLTSAYWFDMGTTRLEHQVLFYNAQINLFTFERFTLNQQADGHMQERYHYESWIAEPYRHQATLTVDIIFVLLVLRLMQSAMAELLPALSGGIEGLRDYIKFWKVVDWIAIIGGLTNVVLWIYFFTQVNFNLQDAIDRIPKEALDARVLSNYTYLSEHEVAEIIPMDELTGHINNMYEIATEIYDYHMIMRCCFVSYFFVLVLKLFYVYRANARLSIVVNTLVTCSDDVAHFFIVVFAIFTCFGLAGHLLLGHRHKVWSSVLGALYSCWTSSASLEDFDDFSIPMQVLGFTWTLTFEILVQRICLNMLLCIVFDAYGAVKGAAGTPQTIVAQFREAVAKRRETRSYVSLWTIIVSLEDEAHPAHPGDIVTARSLRRAFENEKMTRNNAEYLIKSVNEYLISQPEAELDITDAVRLVSQIRNKMLRNLDIAEDTLQFSHNNSAEARTAELLDKSAAWAKHSFAHGRASTLEFEAGLGPVENEEEGFEGLSAETCDALEIHMDHAVELLDSCWQEQSELFSAVHEELQALWEKEDRRTVFTEENLHELEAKLQRVERSLGLLGMSFSGTNFSALAATPGKLRDVLEEHEFAMQSIKNSESQTNGLGPVSSDIAALRRKVDKLSGKTGEAGKVHEALWKIEQTLRPLRDGRAAIPMSTFLTGSTPVKK